MKRFIVLCATVALAHGAGIWNDAGAATTAAKPGALQIDAINGRLDALAKYLEAGDVASLAAMWTPDGTYWDNSGNMYKGRDALKKRFENGIAADGKPRVSLTPDDTRVLSPGVVLSEGTVNRKNADGKLVPETRYTMVFTRKGKDWLISSAAEIPIVSDEPAQQPSLNDLAWMIGDWKAENNGSSLKMHIDWAGNKNFVRWNYQISKPGEPTQENIEVIAFDPKNGGIVSWGFDSTGAFGESTWSKGDNGWQVDVVKTAPDGSTVTAHNIITTKGNDSFGWQSIDRTAGGLPIPDTGELVIAREAK